MKYRRILFALAVVAAIVVGGTKPDALFAPRLASHVSAQADGEARFTSVESTPTGVLLAVEYPRGDYSFTPRFLELYGNWRLASDGWSLLSSNDLPFAAGRADFLVDWTAAVAVRTASGEWPAAATNALAFFDFDIRDPSPHPEIPLVRDQSVVTDNFRPLPCGADFTSPLRAPLRGASNAGKYTITYEHGFPQIAYNWVNSPIDYHRDWNGTFTPLNTTNYTFFLSVDDRSELTVDGEGVSVRFPMDFSAPPVTYPVELTAGVVYPLSISYEDAGWDCFLKTGVTGPPGPYDPGLELDPHTQEFWPSPGTNLVDLAPAVRLTGTFDINAEYSILVEHASKLLVVYGSPLVIPGDETAALDLKIYPDAEADWSDGEMATATVRLYENGHEVESDSTIFVAKIPKRECDCGRCCSQGTDAKNRCISFSQSFGSSPRFGGLPTGRALVREGRITSRLYTPSALRYDHPMMRRLIFLDGLDALVRDGLGAVTEYRSGHPAGAATGARGQFFRTATGGAVEELPDGLRVHYDRTGAAVALQPEFGAPVPVSSLGITVETAADGSITAIESDTDGRLTASVTGERAWRLVWTSPAGAFVKRFDFSSDGESVFALHEYRSDEFQFDYRWTFDAALNDFVFEKGVGTSAAVRTAKSLLYDPTNRVWNVVESTFDAAGAVIVATSSVLDRNRHSLVETERRDAVTGRVLASSVVDSAGLVTSETSALGERTEYEYDDYGRVTRETRTAAELPVETTEYAYTAALSPLDFRPASRRTFIGGELALEESFEYTPTSLTVTRTANGVTRTRHTEYDANGRTTLAVPENGRATRTVYSEPDASGGWTETDDTGTFRNGTFALAGDLSTREVRFRNRAGDVVRRESYAYVGGVWRLLSSSIHSYDASHRETSAAYSDGTSSAASWICPGPVFRRDRFGIVTSNVYDSAKLLARTIRFSPLGAVTTDYFRDAEGRVTNEVVTAADCETQRTSRVYDSRGRVTCETDRSGRVTLTEYGADDLTNTVTYADGGTRVTTLYPDGSLRSVTGTAVTPEFHFYGVTNGLRVAEVRYGRADSPRFKRTFTDGFGDIVREERSGANGATLVTENAYDARGNLTARTETGKPQATYLYDDWGNLVSTTQMADGVSRTTESETAYILIDGEVWRGSAQTVSTSDSTIVPLVTESYSKVSGLSLDCIVESFAVDVRGNTNRTWSAADPSAVKRTSWSTRAGVGNVATNIYVDSQPVTNISFSAVVTSREYDAYGRETAAIDGRGNVTRTEYDSLGHVLATVDALTNRTTYAYDAMGRVAAVANALGNATIYEYDQRGNKIYEGGATYPVRCTYDEYGNRTTMTTYRDESAAGDTTTWLYDEPTGLVTNKLYADGKGPSYTYTDDGKLATRAWARGIVTTYAYDGWGNLTNTTYSDETPSVTLAYDALGRQTSAIDAAGTTTFLYDRYGQLTNETVVGVAGTNTIARFYDAYGRDAGYALNGERQTTIAYDPATGRLATMQVFADGSNDDCSASSLQPSSSFTWNYLADSDLKSQLTYPNGLTASWTYDANNQLLQVRNAFPTNIISQFDYTYDAAGRRISCAHSGSAFDTSDMHSYLYNIRSELTNATASADSAYRYGYQYDPIGNRETSSERGTNTTYTANELNQYTNIEYSAVQPSTSNLQPIYDADGNQTLVKTATGIWQVTYNGENRPIRWELVNANSNTSNSNTQTLLLMSYDRMGRRVTKNAQRFAYNGYLQIADNVGNVYVWDCTEPIATRPLVWTRNGILSYYVFDGNKNVSEVIASNKDVAAHYEYAPFGAVIKSTGAEDCPDNPSTIHYSLLPIRYLNPWRFSSEFADDELGCDYYNYREYEPMTGRWMQRDPIEEADVAGLYVFIGNHYGIVDYMGNSDIPGGCYVAIELLLDAYAKMRKANTKGADKWFHCMGMCRASYFCSSVLSFAVVRELFDNVKRLWKEKDGPKEEFLAEMKSQMRDSMRDMDANITGISCRFWEGCRCCCEKYRKQAPSINPDNWF